MKNFVLLCIWIYQKTFSLDVGLLGKFIPFGVCRFAPTCSQYTYKAVEKYGVRKGLFRGIKRILRCHPASEGGYDPVK